MIEPVDGVIDRSIDRNLANDLWRHGRQLESTHSSITETLKATPLTLTDASSSPQNLMFMFMFMDRPLPSKRKGLSHCIVSTVSCEQIQAFRLRRQCQLSSSEWRWNIFCIQMLRCRRRKYIYPTTSHGRQHHFLSFHSPTMAMYACIPEHAIASCIFFLRRWSVCSIKFRGRKLSAVWSWRADGWICNLHRQGHWSRNSECRQEKKSMAFCLLIDSSLQLYIYTDQDSPNRATWLHGWYIYWHFFIGIYWRSQSK